jgi:hypothetical protein
LAVRNDTKEIGETIPYLIYVVHVEFATKRSFHGCRRTDLPSLASLYAGWVDATDLQDLPSFVASKNVAQLGHRRG